MWLTNFKWATSQGLAVVIVGLFLNWTVCHGQNLPSLLTGREFNSTFSITAYDSVAQQWGIAVATNNIYVGNSTIYIQPGVGAISVIAETLPDYGTAGLAQLAKGRSPKQAITFIQRNDSSVDYRQVAVVDKHGQAYAFTGHSLTFMKGNAGHLIGKSYVVMGNQLADSVLTTMASVYEHSSGTLAHRLMKSLMAGQRAGGQINGKQSAALVVKGTKDAWYNQVDLRVDHSYAPFEDLQRLLNYHYGRPYVNRAIQQLKSGNKAQGLALLQQADTLVKGWYGLYSKLAMAYSLAGQDNRAIELIQEALTHEPAWKENLSAFYYLHPNPIYQRWIDESSFSAKDWCNAIQQLLNMNRIDEAQHLAEQTVQRFVNTSYVHFLLGTIYQRQKDATRARQHLERALQLDPKNTEAQQALQKR